MIFYQKKITFNKKDFESKIKSIDSDEKATDFVENKEEPKTTEETNKETTTNKKIKVLQNINIVIINLK